MINLKTLVLGALLVGSTAHADKIIPAGHDYEAKLATGYDTDTQRFTGICLDGVMERHGQQKANVSYSQTLSESSLQKELGFDAGTKFRYGAAKVSMSANFLKSQRSSSTSIVAVYSGDYKFKNLMLTFRPPSSPKLSKEEIKKEKMSGEGLSVYGDDSRWQETCGDEYVEQIERGAKLYYSIRIDFSTQEEKDLFETNFNYDSSYASVQAHLKNSKNSYSKNTQVTIGALQLGGEVRLITEMFNPEGGTSTEEEGASMSFIKCSFGDFSKCDRVMANAWDYATKKFKEQLKSDDNDGLKENGPAYIKYLTKKYTSAGLYPQYSSVMNKDIIQKRKQIENLFDNELLLNSRIFNTLNSGAVVLSPRQLKVYTSLEEVSRNNLDVLVAAAESCYNYPQTCASELDSATASVETINEEDLHIEPEVFRQYCELAKSVVAEKSLRESIAGMIASAKKLEPGAFNIPVKSEEEKKAEEVAGGVNTAPKTEPSAATIPVDECLTSDIVFSRNTTISFKGQNISTLKPLQQYKHFEVVDLSDNNIEDIAPIFKWKNLVDLNLHNNKVRDLKGIEVLSHLTYLRVSNNRLRTIEQVAGLPNLVRVDARNNYAEVQCPVIEDSNLKVCLVATIKTDSNFLPVSTNATVPMFLPSVAKLENGDIFITGFGAMGTRFNSGTNAFSAVYGLKNTSYGAQATALKDGNVLISGGWMAPSQMYLYDVANGSMIMLPSLKVGRADHQTTLLADGRVLISGGYENPEFWNDAKPSFTAEIFDPLENSSAVIKTKMHAPRAWHTTNLLDDGTVLLVGGYGNANSLATAEIFNPDTMSFKLVKYSMSESRGGHTATKLNDGTVLIVGGFMNKNEAVATAEIYVPETQSFKPVFEPLNAKRGHHAAVLLANGKVLITGGSEVVYVPDAPIENSVKGLKIINTGEVYDPAENSFAEVPVKMHLPRSRHSMVEIKPGLVLIVGGIDKVATENSEVFSYTDTLINGFPLP